MRAEPTFELGATRPSYLSPLAAKEWRRVAPELTDQGILTDVSASLLASYCQSFALWREALADIAERGATILCKSTTRTGETITPKQNPSVKNMLQFQRAMLESAKLFGLSPLDSSKVDARPAPPDPKDDPWKTLMEM